MDKDIYAHISKLIEKNSKKHRRGEERRKGIYTKMDVFLISTTVAAISGATVTISGVIMLVYSIKIIIN